MPSASNHVTALCTSLHLFLACVFSFVSWRLFLNAGVVVAANRTRSWLRFSHFACTSRLSIIFSAAEALESSSRDFAIFATRTPVLKCLAKW